MIIIALMYFNLCSCNDNTKKNTSINEVNKLKLTPQLSTLKANLNTIDKNIRCIYQDKNGNYWIGTNAAGVYLFGENKMNHYTIKDGLADNQVVSIQEDDLGNIWFGSGGFRISKFDGITFTIYSNQVKLTKGTENDWVSKSNDLWFYAGGGVFRYSNPSLLYLPFDLSISNTQSPFSLSRYGVYCTLKDKKGNVWFGTQAEGVCKFDGKTLIWFKEKGLAGPAVLGLFEDSKGNIWFGNNGRGLFRYDGKTMKNLTKENNLDNDNFRVSGKSSKGTLARVYSINEDNDGNIWVGTVDAGVWKYDGNHFTNYTTKDGLTSDAVNTIYKDKNGDLWFGTDSNGVCQFNGTKFINFESADTNTQ